MGQMSRKAKAVLDRLNEQERGEIKKDNPFLVERNEALRRLWARGVKGNILVELSGLTRSAISRIIRGTKGWISHKRHKNSKV